MFCPDIKDNCRKDLCTYWYLEYNGCAKVLASKYEAKMFSEWKDEDDSGLTQIKNNIYSTLNKNIIKQVAKSTVVSEEDRKLLLKLNDDHLSAEKLIALKRNRG
jgi:hypothetical protein